MVNKYPEVLLRDPKSLVDNLHAISKYFPSMTINDLACKHMEFLASTSTPVLISKLKRVRKLFTEVKQLALSSNDDYNWQGLGSNEILASDEFTLLDKKGSQVCVSDILAESNNSCVEAARKIVEIWSDLKLLDVAGHSKSMYHSNASQQGISSDISPVVQRARELAASWDALEIKSPSEPENDASSYINLEEKEVISLNDPEIDLSAIVLGNCDYFSDKFGVYIKKLQSWVQVSRNLFR